ncbi:MAG: EAL domain-containing protein [Novosphingobium sp.]
MRKHRRAWGGSLMVWPIRRKTAEKKRTTRLSIFLWAFCLCTFSAIIGLPEPLEDIFRGARNLVRARPADQSIVVIGIDDKTIAELGSFNFSRSHDARVVNQLFAMGARKVFYDKVFADRDDQAGDDTFAKELRKHTGKVFLGAMFVENRITGGKESVLPIRQFREIVPYRSLFGTATPFSLSAELSYADSIPGKAVPGIAAELANVVGRPNERFRPDWSIIVKSVPTVSYVDVFSGKVDKTKIAGKDIIVGYTTAQSPDFIQVAGQDWFPGIYVHVVGAQTLREGTPRNAGWIPSILVAAILSILFLRAKSRVSVTATVLVALTTVAVVPFLLDTYFITADVISAIAMFVIVAYRWSSLRELSEAKRHNAGTHLPNLAVLREEPLAAVRPLIAMRIKNYAAIGASFANSVEDELVTEVARRLTLPGENTKFYQAEDVLFWPGPALAKDELEGHMAGLARLIETQFVIQNRKIDVHVAFGVDIDTARPVPNRIGRAMVAADNAAARHLMMQFNTSDDDEAGAWELSLMSELDAAIDAGDIWIAYQPQIDLRDDSISGAEALVRWQHPVRGAISPETFILAAESHNRMKRLTFHVLDQATLAAKSIVAANPAFRLSVNVSAGLLELSGLPEQIAAALKKNDFPARNLTLEVTESAPFKERSAVVANLKGIAELGIDLSIDDYGTGNATLEYLRSVPCQEIKIDRRFVAGLGDNSSDMLLVESTIDLAHGLGRRVIAEGIEDPETLELLRAIGCDIAQGFYLAKPMRIEALEVLLATGKRTRAA